MLNRELTLVPMTKKNTGVPYFPSSYYTCCSIRDPYNGFIIIPDSPRKKKKKKHKEGETPFFMGLARGPNPGPPHLYESQSGVPKLISSKMEPRDHLKGFVREISGWKFTGGNLGI